MSAEYLCRRIRRLITPYCLYGLFFILLDQFFTGFSTWDSGIYGILYSRYCFYRMGTPDNILLLGNCSNGSLWLLTCLLSSYVLLYAIGKITRLEGQLTCILLFVLVAALWTYCPVLLPWSLDTAFVGAIFLWIGKKLHRIPLDPLYICCAAVLYLIIFPFLVRTCNLSIGEYGQYGALSLPFYLLSGVLYTYVCIGICKRLRGLLLRVLASIGRYSITLMAVHYPVNTLLARFETGLAVRMVLLIGICALFCWLLSVWRSKSNSIILSTL